jgi:hypothetical protein
MEIESLTLGGAIDRGGINMSTADCLVLLSRDLDSLNLKGVDAWETGIRMANTLIQLKHLIEAKENGGEKNEENSAE